MASFRPSQKAVDLLFALNGAITNIRLYPPDSNIVTSGIHRLYQAIADILETEESLEYAEAESKLLIQGDVLREKLQKSDRVRAFKAMMADLGINSITFERGLDEEELYNFLQILAKSTEELDTEGGLPGFVEKQGIFHVRVAEKVYTKTDGAEKQPTASPGEQQGLSGPAAGLFADALERIAESGDEVFADANVEASLPDVFSQLVEAGEKKQVVMLLKRMEKALANENVEIRKSVATIMSRVDEKLESTGHTGLRVELSKTLSAWSRFETEAVDAFEMVSGRTANLVRRLVKSGKRDKVARIIDSYDQIAREVPARNDAIQNIAQNMVQQLAEEELLDDLMAKTFKKTGETDQGPQKEDIDSLVSLGSKNMETLLDRLRESSDMSDRNRIIQTITQVGPQAVPPLLRRLGEEAPWYYVRNLVLLLGRLGNEEHLPALEKCLDSTDYRVQREAIKSIQNIGGRDAGRILHDKFEYVDEQLQPYIISVIGALQYKPAIPWLIDKLSSNPLVASRGNRDEIREKACEALGRMKAGQAISALDSIIRKKKFFDRKEPESVRSAAVRALAEIKR